MYDTSSRVLFIAIVILISLGGCKTGISNSNAAAPPAANTPGGSSPAQVAQAKPFAAADVAKLKWIEGTWRGTGEELDPFYTRYRFDGDSALVLETFEDEKLDKVADTTRFELKDGQFTGDTGSSLWTANEITDNSATFARVASDEPAEDARPNQYKQTQPTALRWQNDKDGTWKVIVDWPADAKKPARQQTFVMERWPQSGQ
jgi:hypothetical protein